LFPVDGAELQINFKKKNRLHIFEKYWISKLLICFMYSGAKGVRNKCYLSREKGIPSEHKGTLILVVVLHARATKQVCLVITL
jgi:hypothetical protein